MVDKAVSLRGIRLMHRKALRLEGDALLPLDLWNAWPNTSLSTLLDDETVSKVSLIAHDLNLLDTAQLTGLAFPIAGTVRGNLSAEGPLGALKTSGALVLTGGRLPLGWSGIALTGAEGEVAFDGQMLRVEVLTGRHPTGDLTARGEIDFTNFRDPALKLAVTSAKSGVRLFPSDDGRAGISADAVFALLVTGPLSAATMSGDATVMSAAAAGFDREMVERWLTGDLVCALPPVLDMKGGPWSEWRFDVRGSAGGVSLLGQAVSADLRLSGTGAEPALIGQLEFSPAQSPNPPRAFVSESQAALTLQRAALHFREGFPGNPVVSAEAEGIVSGAKFSICLTGTLDAPMRVFICDPPLTEKAIRQALSGASAARYFSGESRFSLLVPVELREGVELSEWPGIEAEPGAPAVEDQPAPTGGAPL